MFSRRIAAILAVLATAGAPAQAHAQQVVAALGPDGAAPASTKMAPLGDDVLLHGGVDILDAYIARRIRGLEERSPTFREAMRRARTTRIPVVIGTPVQVQQRLAHRWSLGDRNAPGYLGEFLMRLTAAESVAIELIAIRVDVDEIRRLPWWRRMRGNEGVRRLVDEAMDAILIHEIWGHLIPVLEAGDYTGNCPDPRGDDVVMDSCVMKREAVVRSELGLPPRESYQISLR